MDWKRELRYLFTFLLLGIGLYAHTLHNEFVFDDEEQIVNSEIIHDIRNWKSLFRGSTMNQSGATRLAGIYYKPVMSLVYMVNWHFFGNNPVPYRLFQVGLHSVNAFFVFWLFRLFFPISLAAWCGLVFLVHPINTESAIYLANLQDVMFTFFGLAALLAYHYKKSLFIVGTLLLLSLLSKETGLGYWGLIGLACLMDQKRSKFNSGLLLIVVAAVYSVLRFGVANLSSVHHGVAPISLMPFNERILNLPMIWTHYLILLFWPQKLTTTQNWVIREFSFDQVILPILFLALMFGVLWYLLNLIFRHYPPSNTKPLRFFTLWYIGGMLIHSQLLAPLDGTVADRWFYLPMIGLLGVGAFSLQSVWPKYRWLRVCVAILIIPLAARARVRGYNWVNGFALYEHDLKLAPDAYDIQNNYGVELYRRGRRVEALKHFKKSTELLDHWMISWNNLGAAYENIGQTDEALKAYCNSISQGVYYLAYMNYPNLLMRVGQYQQALDFIHFLGLVNLPNNRQLLQIHEIATQQLKLKPGQRLVMPCKPAGERH